MPHVTRAAATVGMLSLDGRCKTLDKRANGYVRAEGVAARFTGWSAAVCRAFPANAGLFAGVELMSRLLKDV